LVKVIEMPHEAKRIPLSGSWPNLEEAYTDEFGDIDPDIYKIAGMLWRRAELLARGANQDTADAQRLLIKAVAIVTRKFDEQPGRIVNVRGYLFKTYRHLVLEQLEKQSHHTQLEEDIVSGFLANHKVAEEADFNRLILIDEIMQRADPWTRKIFQLLVLGHHWTEIAFHFGKAENGLRSKWSKKMEKLAGRIATETREAERRILRRRRNRFDRPS
jgi:hypothetical protein